MKKSKPNLIRDITFPVPNIHSYERYLPTAFDGSLSLLEKINKVIHFLYQYSDLTKEMIEKWNEVYDWVMNEGLENSVVDRLNKWIDDGTLEQIINENIFNELNDGIENLEKITDELNTIIINLDNVLSERIDIIESDLNKKFVYENVISYGAHNDGVTPTSKKIQHVLDLVSKRGGGVVYIPTGVYLIDKMLVVGANTTIKMENDTVLLRGHSGNFMTNGKMSEHVGVRGYTGNSNIKILNGVFDNNIKNLDLFPTKANNMIIFGHCENIEIRNVTFYDTISYHALDLNGIKNLTVDNCKFLGFINLSNNPNDPPREAIQVAEANFSEFGVNDYTPCVNIKIENCVFDRSENTGYFEVAIGNHYSRHGVYQRDINIVNNTIIGCTYTGIRPYKWDSTNITSNYIKDCETAILISNVGANTESSRFPDGTQSNIPSASKNIIIKGNQMFNIRGNGVTTSGQNYQDVLATPSNITISENIFNEIGDSAISLTLARHVSVINNVFFNIQRGVWVNSCQFISLTSNNFKSSYREFIYINSNNGIINSENINININSFDVSVRNGIFIQDVSFFSIISNSLNDCGVDDGVSRGGFFVERSENGNISSNSVFNKNDSFGIVVRETCLSVVVSNNSGNKEVRTLGDTNGIGIMGVDGNNIPTIITLDGNNHVD